MSNNNQEVTKLSNLDSNTASMTYDNDGNITCDFTGLSATIATTVLSVGVAVGCFMFVKAYLR